MGARTPCCAACARSRVLRKTQERKVLDEAPIPQSRILFDVKPIEPSAKPVAGPALATRTQVRAGLVAPSPSTSAPNARFSTRALVPNDLPWVESWCGSLGLLPLPSGRVRMRILSIDDRRVGFIASREDWIDTGRGRESVVWIVAAFLIPSVRGQGNLARFAELLTTELFPRGSKLAARVALHNTRMQAFMRAGGWRKLQATHGYADFVLDLDGPYRVRPNKANGLVAPRSGVHDAKSAAGASGTRLPSFGRSLL